MFPSNKFQQHFTTLDVLDITLYCPKSDFIVSAKDALVNNKAQNDKLSNNESVNADSASAETTTKNVVDVDDVKPVSVKSNNAGLASDGSAKNNTIDENVKSADTKSSSPDKPSLAKPGPDKSNQAISRQENQVNQSENKKPLSNSQQDRPQSANSQVVDSLGSALISKFDEVELDYDISELQQKVSGCEACSLSIGRKQVVFGQGNSEARILIVGDMPNEQEDEAGLPLLNESLTLLEAMLKSITLSINDVFVTNIVKCHSKFPISNIGDEVSQCREHFDRQLSVIEPELIWVLGDFAAQALLESDQSVAELRGKAYQYQSQSNSLVNNNDNTRYPMVLSHHPKHLLANPDDKKFVWQDLKHIAKRLRLKP